MSPVIKMSAFCCMALLIRKLPEPPQTAIVFIDFLLMSVCLIYLQLKISFKEIINSYFFIHTVCFKNSIKTITENTLSVILKNN